mgnify:CR=1 FL=1
MDEAAAGKAAKATVVLMAHVEAAVAVVPSHVAATRNPRDSTTRGKANPDYRKEW